MTEYVWVDAVSKFPVHTLIHGRLQTFFSREGQHFPEGVGTMVILSEKYAMDTKKIVKNTFLNIGVYQE
jgi:hypothetical protein